VEAVGAQTEIGGHDFLSRGKKIPQKGIALKGRIDTVRVRFFAGSGKVYNNRNIENCSLYGRTTYSNTPQGV
jgi:hypothetical protein